MIWAILAILIFTTPGSEFELNITEFSSVSVDDACILFEETLSNSANLSAGSHRVIVGFNCKPGDKVITANGTSYAIVRIGNLNESALAKAFQLQKEAIMLRKELNSTIQLLEKTGDELKRLEYEKNLLENELGQLRNKYSDLQSKYEALIELQFRYEALKKDLESKRSKIAEMEKEIESLTGQSTTYRAATFFLISMFVGSFTAAFLMSRKS